MENSHDVATYQNGIDSSDVKLSATQEDTLPLTIQVELCQKSSSFVESSILKEKALSFLRERGSIYGDIIINHFEDPILKDNAAFISITDYEIYTKDDNLQVLDLASANLQIHVFKLYEEPPGQEMLEEEEDLSAANHWILPSIEYQGLWESLIYEPYIKANLLNYAHSTILFSDKKVDANIISWNKVILLHGPPGTGKTSLCKALSHKLAIVLSDRYSYGQLVEINSHSLFSKWFSESGKLVMKMFTKIQELIDDPNAFVCVLIDEVESLTAARSSAMSGSEPSDSIRVVNALLTQIDAIKKNPNVLILTTSNITGAIDLAFVDRADIKQYIGLPTKEAIYKIYHQCINELMRTGIVNREQIFELQKLKLMKFHANKVTEMSLRLQQICDESYGLSGRTLRKIPFLAHAMYLKSNQCNLVSFLNALELAVKKQFEERKNLSNT